MIKSIRITTLFLTILLYGFGQELPKLKTKEHQQIIGTNIFIIPPVSFEQSNNFKGFKKTDDQTSMIIIVEIPGPYSEVTKGFNSEMLKTKGMDLKTKKEIKVSEYNGLLIELEQQANEIIFSKHILIYGNEKSTTLINGACLKDSLQLSEIIKQSILTTIIDSDIKVNPRDNLQFTLDENVGSLKFHSVIGNGMLLNRDLKIPTESVDKATLFSDKSFGNTKIENKKLFCISRLKKLPTEYSIIPSKGINEIEIDKLKGFELFAKNNENVNEEMYQVILFEENGCYYILGGTYLKDSKQAIKDIKNVIMTFKRKE